MLSLKQKKKKERNNRKNQTKNKKKPPIRKVFCGLYAFGHKPFYPFQPEFTGSSSTRIHYAEQNNW